MKKKLLIVLGLALVCTGCGSKNAGTYEDAPGTEAAHDYSGSDGYMDEALYDYDLEMADDAVYGESESMAAPATETGIAESGGGVSEPAAADNGNAKKLSREMLIFRGDLRIDTLDFKKSVDDFKTLLNDKGGFVESEHFTDNYSTSEYYYIDDRDKHNVYTATVRIPSTEYDGVMNSASTLGDVRNRTSNASNVTQQYSTYKSQLEIYEAEYKRYLTLLESATKDEYALKIENELFDIQIQIADLKSGITNIENDVAYSYINIIIKEVSRYEEEPVKTDTFTDRLKNTCKESLDAFLEFLESVLFYFIRNVYYIIIWGVIILVVYRVIRKKLRAGKERTHAVTEPAKEAGVTEVAPETERADSGDK